MMQRRRHQNARAEPQAPPPEPPPPESDIDDAEIEAAVAQAITQAINLGKTGKTEPARLPPTPAQAAIGSTIHYDSPRPDTVRPRASSHEDQLLHHTAIHRLAGQTGHQHPA